MFVTLFVLLFMCAIIASGMSGIGFYQALSVIHNGTLAAWFWCAETMILIAVLLIIMLTVRLERGYAVMDAD